MNVSRMGRRLAVSGIATAIAAAGLVGGATTAANAAGGTATYNCATALGDVPIPVTVSSQIPDAVPTGWDVPSAVPVNVVFDIPATLLGGLAYFGAHQIGGSSDNFAMILGDNAATVPVVGLASAPVDIPLTGDLLMSATGANGAFTTPAPGRYDISLPNSFDMKPVKENNEALAPFTCTLADPATAKIGQVDVLKQTSTTTGVVKKSHTGYKGTAKVVRQLGGAGLGKVVAKLDGKKIGSKALSKKGAASFSLPKKMKKGKHSLKLVYKGDSATQASNKTVTFKVK